MTIEINDLEDSNLIQDLEDSELEVLVGGFSVDIELRAEPTLTSTDIDIDLSLGL